VSAARTTRKTPFIVRCGLVLVAAIPVHSQTYSLTDLGLVTDLPPQSESRPNAINSHSQVAGVNVSGGFYRAVRYDGSWTDLGTLGGSESFAGGIEVSGRVAGYARLGSGLVHAFLWTPGGTDGIPGNPQMKDLGTLGGNNSQGYAVNDTGQVTGYSDLAGGVDPRVHAFVYANGKMTDIGKSATVLPNSFGYGINRLGHVAGTAYDGAYAAPRAFLYDGTKGVEIGALGALGSTALSLNDADHVVGYATTVEYFDRAFHYVAGSIMDLGTLGGRYSYAIGINNSNAIVGGSFVDTADSVYHAFLYANGRMQDLNALLDATGAGWTLAEARAINDAGQIIGTGMFQGATHGFLLTPTGGALPPKITMVNVVGNNLLLSFHTVDQAMYLVETSQTLASGSWTVLATGIQGNGGIVSITNVGGATQPYRFYRVKVSGG
jgi:probable HAF family extracellular repeat protein